MSIAEIIPAVRALSRGEKFRLAQLLLFELAPETLPAIVAVTIRSPWTDQKTSNAPIGWKSPRRGSTVARAAELTRGLVLAHQGHIVAALYSANCGGHTRSLVEAGWNDGEYPYFGVACPRGGQVAGHQIGLCQAGAAEMAQRGVGFREILAHFYPATALQPSVF